MDNLTKAAVLCLGIVGCMVYSTHAQGSNELCQYSPASSARGNFLLIDNVREDLEQGATVTHLLVNGDDSQIDLWTDNEPTNFHFDRISRNITVASPLTHNELGFSMIVKCSVSNPPSSFINELRVEIRTLDLNDHAPQFINAPYYTNISELAPVGTTLISSISATDEDTSNPFVFYSVLPGPFADHFEFPLPAQGKLVLTKMVDFEEVQNIELTIQATDNHPNIPNVDQVRLTSITTVNIQVFDESDQNPVFTQATYVATLTETDSIGTSVITDPVIRAYDPDLWQNTTLVYSIVPDTTNAEHTYFTIDQSSGQLSLARNALQRGTKFGILIKATKLNYPDRYSQALVRIWVQAANESPPRFEHPVYMATLVENTVIGSPVVSVKAVDNDEILMPGDAAQATVLRYSFADDYEEFALNSMTGAITTRQELNFEENENYILQVEVTDGQYSDTTQVEVTVVNINNHNPIFSQSFYTIDASKVAKNELLVQPQALDADRYSTITYSFLNNSTYTNFTINAETGEVTCLINEVDETSLVVLAKDNGIPPRMASCLVRITAKPSRPGVTAEVTEKGESNIVAIVVLSVLAALLFIVIIIMAIYIYRSTQDTQSKSSCVRSQSFEQNPMNFSSKNYRSYLDPVQAYQPSDRHLQLYNGVTIDDATSTQENPFTSHSSSERSDTRGNTPYTRGGNLRDLPSHSAAVNAGLYPQQYPINGTTFGESSDRRSGSTLPGDHNGDPEMAHIEYDSTVSPMDMDARRLNGFHGYNQDYVPQDMHNQNYGARNGHNQAYVPHDMQSSPRSSMHSDHSYNHGELTSFKVGSTTQLVPSSHNIPKSSRSIHKGSGNISFVDNSPTNSMYSSLTSQQSGLDPGTSDHHKPGITVYY